MGVLTTKEERGMQVRLCGRHRLVVMFYAAFIAIGVNTVMLKVAPLFGIQAGAGGLFGVLRLHFGEVFSAWGLSALWSASLLPQPGTLAFYIFFHSLIGFIMAGCYVYLIEKYLAGSGVQKGMLFALLPWGINSMIILPLLGKGFAGSQVLDGVGLVYFFVANATYGVLLGHWYERFTLKRL